ncbi:PHP domain-containing protein [Anaeromicropila populeti]|uniref:Polymerase/histidinol phosphatase N-terminal domain-containing protein n=1 Tax=Anaeromicropila populeti TaxID=37658 RepID=A0A1I6L6Z4_9FIRM|nr:PHP domain-containing protein [Anaeromicropila populeti]SFR99030.1 hypothetical protein SAMN05661086_03087 [Anaeromicropila populeti]
MRKIDLHIHSEFSSDGELAIKDILDLSKKTNMEVIAITDHNSVKGVQKAIEYGKMIGLQVISGIEMDCTYKDINLHVLGYFIDPSRKEYEELENDIFQQEVKAAVEKINRLTQATDVIVNADEIFTQAEGKIVTGEMIAENILHNRNNLDKKIVRPYLPGGEKSDMPYVHFYWDFFSQGKAAYVPIHYVSFREAVSLIKSSGGVPVIAHPGNNLREKLEILDELIQEGLEGIEVFSTYHSIEQTRYFFEKAVQEDLLITCGSDFHGKNKPNIQIGSYTKIEQDVDVLRGLQKYL